MLRQKIHGALIVMEDIAFKYVITLYGHIVQQWIVGQEPRCVTQPVVSLLLGNYFYNNISILFSWFIMGC